MEISVRWLRAPAFVDSPLASPSPAENDSVYRLYRLYCEDIIRNDLQLWARIVAAQLPATARLLDSVGRRWPVLPENARRYAEQLLRQVQLDYTFNLPLVVDAEDYEVVERADGGAEQEPK